MTTLPNEPDDVVDDHELALPTMSDEVVDSPVETPTTGESPAADIKIRTFFEDIDAVGLSALIDARKRVLGDAAFTISANTPGTYDAILAEQISSHGLESERAQRALPADKMLLDTKLVREGKVILGTRKARRDSGKGDLVTGAAAIAAFAISDGWMKRISLYNSGFMIDLTDPDLAVLNIFFNKANDRTEAYGRQFGGLFFFFHDLMIKEAAVELVMPLVINSTLKNALRGSGNTLLRGIKLVDFKSILTSIGAMMFPNGYSFTHVCKNPAGTCTHHYEELIDLNKLVRHDFSKLPEACITHMQSMAEVTAEKLTDYHKKLGFDGVEIRHRHYGFTMRMPSLFDYLEFGRAFNGNLLKDVFANEPDALSQQVMLSYYQIYVPFIARMTRYNETGMSDVVVEDSAAIAKLLLRIQADDRGDTQLYKAFDDYIAASEITHICYPATPCPVCQHMPEGGYHTFDPMLNFFTLSLMKLTPD